MSEADEWIDLYVKLIGIPCGLMIASAIIILLCVAFYIGWSLGGS
jgi:hypothetical protein